MSSPTFPLEILDHIVDLLHDNTEALKQCCLVSKSWIPRTQRHLFAHIQFLRNRLKLWKVTFPDPTNSPAYHTRTLTICLSAEGVEEGDWILPFSHVQRLILLIRLNEEATSFVPLYKLSPSLKSFQVYFYILHPDAFNLIRSLSLLEDLTLSSYGTSFNVDKSDGPLAPALPSASPSLTGSLGIFLKHWGAHAIYRLLDLPNGLHFREIRLFLCNPRDLPPTGELVTACSGTLEHLYVSFAANREFISVPLVTSDNCLTLLPQSNLNLAQSISPKQLNLKK